MASEKYLKRKAKNDEYRKRIRRFTLQFSLGDMQAREWFEQQPESGVYLKKLILEDKERRKGELPEPYQSNK